LAKVAKARVMLRERKGPKRVLGPRLNSILNFNSA
jgi:hypothetical protein